jgi:hypothetical protein
MFDKSVKPTDKTKNRSVFRFTQNSKFKFCIKNQPFLFSRFSIRLVCRGFRSHMDIVISVTKGWSLVKLIATVRKLTTDGWMGITNLRLGNTVSEVHIL